MCVFFFNDTATTEIYTLSLHDALPIYEAMEGADLVVHTAAALPLYSPEDIYTTDVEGTRNVLDAALRHGIKRVAHVSSTAVYGIPDHHPLYEIGRAHGLNSSHANISYA